MSEVHCLNINCPERKSTCCGAKSALAKCRCMDEHLVCSECRKPFFGGKCTAPERMSQPKCSCREPHISDRIVHRYNGLPCYVSDSQPKESQPSSEGREVYELLPGAPELTIAKIVRRSHATEVCPHKGNCLNEREMIEELGNYIRSLLSSSTQKVYEELLMKIPKEKIYLEPKDLTSQEVNMMYKGFNDCLEEVRQIILKKMGRN